MTHQQHHLPPEVPSPKSKEEALAWDLASGLSDMKGLPLYLSYSQKYPEYLLRKVMAEVKEVPAHKIKKSRGALFNYIIQQHAQKEPHDPRD